MRLRPYLALAVLMLLAGCAPVHRPRLTAIVGATLIDGTGAPPVPQSVVLVAGPRILAAGSRATTPVPPDAERIDARGKFVVPPPIDLGGNRNGGRMAMGLDGVRQSDAEGARSFFGMVVDTEDLAPELLRRWRDERVVFAPALARFEGSGELLARAMRNTRRLAAAGVALALDSGDASGNRTGRELELLAHAGLPAEKIVAAASGGAALALGLTDIGTLEAGRRADLLLVRDPCQPRSAERKMQGGAWIR